MRNVEVLILGAGASGLMCAAIAASRGRKTLVIDHAPAPGRKILVSGGGRCNFTNLHATPAHYRSENPHFVKSALSRFGPADFVEIVKRHRIPFHEKKDGQLFCDRSARAILDLLLSDAKAAGASVECDTRVKEVRREGEAFLVSTSRGEVKAARLVVATGGLSFPDLGASDLGVRLARQFGLEVVALAPALVGLAFPGAERKKFEGLAGIHLTVGMRCGEWSRVDDLMITHKGLSGPVVLNASLVWEPGREVSVNWVPGKTAGETFEQLKRDRKTGGRGSFRVFLEKRIPRRLADRLAWHAGAKGAWRDLSDETLKSLAATIHDYRFIPSGTFGYKEAEVTRGGVDTRGISSKTMECAKIPRLYFIGEVLDVTGELGGFNLQWAWSSGWACGQAV